MRCTNCLDTPQCRDKGQCEECTDYCEASVPRPDPFQSYDLQKDSPSLPKRPVPSLSSLPNHPLPNLPSLPNLPPLPNHPSLPVQQNKPAVPNLPNLPPEQSVPFEPTLPGQPAQLYRPLATIPPVLAIPAFPTVPHLPKIYVPPQESSISQSNQMVAMPFPKRHFMKNSQMATQDDLINSQDPTMVSARNNFESREGRENMDMGLSEKEDRFYTIGSFQPGPMQSLLAKLLNISKKDKLQNLVVLAKSQSKYANTEDIHPVIIDTAHVFTKNTGPTEKLDVELHDVGYEKLNLDLTENLNKELDMAIEAKKKLVGDSHLTSDEIDKLIDHAVSLVGSSLIIKYFLN